MSRQVVERSAVEEAMKASEQLLELFFSQSLDGFFFMMLDQPVRWDSSVDKDAALEYAFSHERITKVNDAMLAQYGATREQFCGLTPRDFFAHDLAYGKALWRGFFDAGRLHVETDERRFDGSPIRIEGDYICLYDGEGRITGHFGIQRDVTERHRAEEALRVSEEKFSRAFRSSPLRISISTLDEGRMIEVNDTFLRDFGLTREQVIGRLATDLGLYANPADRSRIVAVLKRDGMIRDFEFEGHTRDGRQETTLLSAEVIDIGGEQCLLAVAYDITERKGAEEEARRSQMELRALAARLLSVREEERRRIAREIHDELGQALTGLKLDAAWLAGRLTGREPELRERATSLASRIDQTISVARRITTELRPSVLDHLGVVAAIEWHATEFQKRTGIAVSLDLPSESLALDDARATNLFRMVQETLTNVARHAKATKVSIILERTGSQIRLEIRDNGRGISRMELSGSHSLGLVGLRERAIACRGELSIRGVPGGGTTVSVRLPLRASAQAESMG